MEFPIPYFDTLSIFVSVVKRLDLYEKGFTQCRNKYSKPMMLRTSVRGFGVYNDLIIGDLFGSTRIIFFPITNTRNATPSWIIGNLFGLP